MSIVRRKRSENYTIVPNDIWEDEWVSFEAKSLLMFLLSRPNDWQVNAKHLQKTTGYGRDKTYKLIAELADRGYIKRESVRGENGSFSGQEMVVYDSVGGDDYPRPDLPDTAEPDTGNPCPGKSGNILSTDLIPITDRYQKKRARGQRLPEDWRPNHDGCVMALELLGEKRFADQLARFRDYWIAQPGQKGVKLDWDATWRNWIRRASDGNKKHESLKPSRSGSVVSIALQELREMQANGE